LVCFVTDFPDKINQLFAEASTGTEVAKSAVRGLEDTFNKAWDIQEQIKSCKSSQNYIPKEEIRRIISQSIENIEEAKRILKRIEELKNMPGYLIERDIKDLSLSLELLECEIFISQK
jgi:hypothetical protein